LVGDLKTKKDTWKWIGWVRFMYGESGWDVICDYTASPAIEALLEKPNAISDRYC
jgi:hypothetical protein